MYDYSSLKQLAKERGQKVDDLLALSPKNDPFYTGSAGQVEGARWFADLHHRFFGGDSGIHLRRIHYRIVSQDPPVLMPSGEPYQNTEGCWNFLTSVSKWARYQGLVDVDAFVDKRNQEPIIHAYFYNWGSEPGSSVVGSWRDEIDSLELPELPVLPDLPSLPALPKLEATGYSDVEQPYLIEIWVEKTTMNDVLEPLCREYGANLVTGAGVVDRDCGSYMVTGSWSVEADMPELLERAQHIADERGVDLFCMVAGSLTQVYEAPVLLSPAPAFHRGFSRIADADASFEYEQPSGSLVLVDGYQKGKR